MTTVENALRQAINSLRPLQQARLEAEVLLAHTLGKPRSYLYARPETPLEAEQLSRYQQLIMQRVDGQPIAYLTGHREFWSLDFEVAAATLIPRPETELLVERALQLLPPARPIVIADLGTGSGAIAIALAHERPHWQVMAVDRSAEGLAIAQRNAARLGTTNVAFIRGHWCNALASGSLDGLVANPPYIADRDPHLQAGDVRFEPRQALAAGPTGLDDLVELINTAGRVLKSASPLLLEHAPEQTENLHKQLKINGFYQIETHRDLAGLERITGARKPA